jgi:hypothetical protein
LTLAHGVSGSARRHELRGGERLDVRRLGRDLARGHRQGGEGGGLVREGTQDELEQAAADRIAAIFAAEGVESWTLLNLCDRAQVIHSDAVGAYVKVLAEREASEVVPGDDQDDDRYDRDEDGGDDAGGASNDNGDAP